MIFSNNFLLFLCFTHRAKVKFTPTGSMDRIRHTRWRRSSHPSRILTEHDPIIYASSSLLHHIICSPHYGLSLIECTHHFWLNFFRVISFDFVDRIYGISLHQWKYVLFNFGLVLWFNGVLFESLSCYGFNNVLLFYIFSLD